jgi:hypothetical protein
MARTTSTADKVSLLNKALRGMFKTLQARPIPGTLRSVADQLHDADEKPLKKRGSR